MKKIALFFLFITPFAVYAHWFSDVTIKGYYEMIKISNADHRIVDSCVVTGHIYDAQTKSLLPYSWVKIKGTEMGISADSLGYYSLKVPLGKYKLIAASGSNVEVSTRVIKFCQDESLKIDFFLGSHIIID